MISSLHFLSLKSARNFGMAVMSKLVSKLKGKQFYILVRGNRISNYEEQNLNNQ